MINVIYLACFQSKPRDLFGYALCEDGVFLASHLSSSVEWLKHDLGLTSNLKHNAYAEHCPGGYKLEWVDNPSAHEGWQTAYAKYTEASQ